MLRTFRYRLYPNKVQRKLIRMNADAGRFVYNWALETKKKAFETDKTILNWYDLNKLLIELKETHPFLQDAYSQSLQQAIRRLHWAFQNFYQRAKKGKEKPGYPKFRSRKHHRQSFDIPQHFSIDFEAEKVQLPKIGKVKAIFHRKFEGTARTCTLVLTKTGKHFISVVVEDGNEFPNKRKVTWKNSIGIDVGLKSYVTTSSGLKYNNPRHLQSSFKRVQCLHRRLSRKKRGSKNREKARQRLARCYERIKNQRADFQQKLSTQLIRENQAIVVEKLKISGMIRNRSLAKQISDAAWFHFFSMLRYKAAQFGVTLIEIGYFEPTSKRCYVCGSKNDTLELSDREWTCTACNTHHDRDINAAKNIKIIGLESYISPREPREEPVKLSAMAEAMKQEASSFG